MVDRIKGLGEVNHKASFKHLYNISQRQHAPAGDGQHCNMGCSE